jgi:hypothetical protein
MLINKENILEKELESCMGDFLRANLALSAKKAGLAVTS